MSPEKVQVELREEVPAPASEVFRCLTTSTGLRQWFCDFATVDARPEGRILLAWNDGYRMAGEFTAIEENRKIAFTWHGKGEAHPTPVEIILDPGQGHTIVRLTHAGLSENDAEGFRREWESSLANLADLQTTGFDPRLYNRPMMGIGLDTFDEHDVERLGVPVSKGMRLSGTVAGMGAEKAGLKKDDVVVMIQGTEIETFSDIGLVLNKHKAGDTISVAFYRGPELITTQLTLGGRPKVEVPATLTELSQKVRTIYAETDRELSACFAGISDDVAATRPGEHEWSALQIIAHMIHTERGQQNYIEELFYNDVLQGDTDNGGNLQARIDATVEAYPTINALLMELASAEIETASMVARLPDEFITRKPSYTLMASALLQHPDHTRDHIRQIKETLAQVLSMPA